VIYTIYYLVSIAKVLRGGEAGTLVQDQRYSMYNPFVMQMPTYIMQDGVGVYNDKFDRVITTEVR
jgi:hypothetical protein